MRVLIVEDDMIIAGGLAPVVTEAGHDLVGLAADRDTAVALLRSSDIDLALVDLRLMDGLTGLDVAREAGEAGVAVLFTTANADMLPSGLDGSMGVIEKPYTASGVREALDFLHKRLAGDACDAPPRCLKLAVSPSDPIAGDAA